MVKVLMIHFLILMIMVGFLDGINDSLKNPNPIETMEEDTEVNLDYDMELLYKNMVDARADWLYELPQWDNLLTEERRKELVKDVKKKGEDSKVAVRNIRRDANDSFKKLAKTEVSEDEIKDLEDSVQKLTDKFIKDIDTFYGEFQAGADTESRGPLTNFTFDDAEPSIVTERG